jgi:hypothetical protein
MRNPHKIFFRISISLFVFFCLIPILWKVQPLQFASTDIAEWFNNFFLIGLLFTFLFSLTWTLKGTNLLQSFGIIMLTLLITGFVFFLIAIASFGNMCSYSTGKTIFINKKNKDRIVLRYFGCGATDSTPASTHVSKIRYFTPLFMLVSDIDTTKIDRRQWVRVATTED